MFKEIGNISRKEFKIQMKKEIKYFPPQKNETPRFLTTSVSFVKLFLKTAAQDYATESISKNKRILLPKISCDLRIGMWQEIDYKVALFIG